LGIADYHELPALHMTSAPFAKICPPMRPASIGLCRCHPRPACPQCLPHRASG